jgi:hypothetical protein
MATFEWEHDKFVEYINTCELMALDAGAYAYEDSKYRLRGRFWFGLEAGAFSLGMGTPFTVLWSGWAWKLIEKADLRFDIIVNEMRDRNMTWKGCSKWHKRKMWAEGHYKP